MNPDTNNDPLNTPSNTVPMQPSLAGNVSPVNQYIAQQPSKKGFSKLKFVGLGIFVFILLLGGSGAAYMQFIYNSPEKVWARALESSQKGLDSIAQKASENAQKAQKIDGTFKMSSPTVVDGSLHMLTNEQSAEMTMDIGAMGARVNADVRLVDVAASEMPDIYLKLDGLKSVSSLLSVGGPELEQYSQLIESVDGQWYVVDHTVFDQLVASGYQSGGMPSLSNEDIKAMYAALLTVIRDDLLSSDPNKAVFEVVKTIGKEDFEGTSTYHYEVGVNKEHLKSFLSDLKTAMAATKFAELVASASGKSYEEAINLEEFFKSIDKQDFSNAKADVWVESNGKYIRNIRLYPVNGDKDKNRLDIAIPYAGGEAVPLAVKATFDDDGMVGTTSSGIDFNTSTGDMHGWGKADFTYDTETTVNFEYDLTAKATDDTPNSDKPSDAKNFMELFGAMGLGSSGEFTSEQMTTQSELDNFDNLDGLLNQFPASVPQDDTELQ